MLLPVGFRSHSFKLFRLFVISLLIGLFIVANAWSQSAISVGTASGYQGAPASISLRFTPGSTAVSTLQFDLNFPAALTYANVSTGSAATSAEKNASGSTISGGARFLIYGLNRNIIGSGEIANIQFYISSTATIGSIPVTISGIVAASPDAGQVTTSGTSGSVVVLVSGGPSDTTPPTISDVSSPSISSTRATISWNTNELSDSQVEYGTTTGYGKATLLNSTKATAHTQFLTELMAGTLYHYRVKSKDTAGNIAQSGDFTFKTAGQDAAPEITGVKVTDISNRSATISWTTDKSSDSEVEYWVTGNEIQISAVRNSVTSHCMVLNGLHQESIYYFRVKSADAAKSQAVSSELSFTTTMDGTPMLVWPRFSSGDNVLGINTMVGLGLINMDPGYASLEFTAMDDTGYRASGYNLANPAYKALEGGDQLPILDWELFGSGLLDSTTNGWGMLKSTTQGTSGFYLIFDSSLSLMDGGNFSDSKMTEFAFTEIQTDGYNKINIINNNPDLTNVTLNLKGADGTVKSSVARSINAYGSLTADLFEDLFPGIEPDATDYVRVSSEKPVQSFQVMRQKSGDIATLSGQDLSTGATSLYSPQYAWGGPWRTSLSILNLDSVSGAAYLKFVGEDGTQIGSTKLVNLPANGKVHIDDPAFFRELDLSVTTAGYIEIVSDGVRLAGSTVFGDINKQESYSALALISNLQTSVLFSHVASNDMYYHGIAILNPNSTETTVKLELYAADGSLRRRMYETIGAKQRQSRVLTEYFTALEGKSQTSGFVRLTSTKPIASFSLFGTKDFSVLSAIPPQVVY